MTYMHIVIMVILFQWICSPGNALLTVATGKLSEAESDRAGLVTTHAYAVLNLVEIKVLMCVVCTFWSLGFTKETFLVTLVFIQS